MDEKKGFKSNKALVSFVPPTAGMFVWLAVHLSSHHKFAQIKHEEGPEGVNKMLYDLWTELAESNVSDPFGVVPFPDHTDCRSARCSSRPGTFSTLSPVSHTRARRTLASSVSAFRQPLTRKWNRRSRQCIRCLSGFSRKSRCNHCVIPLYLFQGRWPSIFGCRTPD